MRSPLSYAPCKDTCPPSRYDYNPRPVAPSALSAEPSRVPPPRRRPSVALGSVAEILDLANFKRSYGSSEKDADREPATAVVAIDGHFVSSLSAPVYILGAISKIEVRCEQLLAFNYFFK